MYGAPRGTLKPLADAANLRQESASPVVAWLSGLRLVSGGGSSEQLRVSVYAKITPRLIERKLWPPLDKGVMLGELRLV